MAYELTNLIDQAAVRSALGLKYENLAVEMYDDFNRTDTAPGVLGTPSVGGPWDIRGTGATAGSLGYISGGRFVSNPGDIIYAVQTLSGPVARIGGVIRFSAGNAGTDVATPTFLISPANTGPALIANAGIHIPVTRDYFQVQQILAGGFTTVETKIFPSRLALDTSYTVDIEVCGSVINYSICGIKGSVVNKAIASAQLGPYASFEHYYASSSVREVSIFEKVWASTVSSGRATLAELCVAGYKFSDTGWRDCSGQAHTLTGVNSPTVAAGRVGNGVVLTAASSQKLTTPDHTDLRLANKDWALSLWVNPTSVTGGGTIPVISKDGGGTSIEYSIYLDKGASAFYAVVSADGGTVNATFIGGASPAVAGAWNHILLWYDSYLKVLAIQVNGGVINTAALASIYAGSASALSIGQATWLGGGYFDGMVDEMYLFTSPPGHGGALNASRRAALYNDGEGITWPLGC